MTSRKLVADKCGIAVDDVVYDATVGWTVDGMPWHEWFDAMYEPELDGPEDEADYAAKIYAAAKGNDIYAHESNDRSERLSCGDPDELAAQERWLQDHPAKETS